MKGCPHSSANLCPLYIASHGKTGCAGYGCIDALTGPDDCAVSRDMDYDAALARLNEYYAKNAPSHTDLMISPEDIDAFFEENTYPDGLNTGGKGNG